MKLKFGTPVLALIVALSTVSFVSTPTQATARNAYIIGQTYQTSSGNYVKFVGTDRYGQPLFTQIIRKKIYNNHRYSNRSRGYSRRSHYGGHRSHRNHASHGGHRSYGGHRGHRGHH